MGVLNIKAAKNLIKFQEFDAGKDEKATPVESATRGRSCVVETRNERFIFRVLHASVFPYFDVTIFQLLLISIIACSDVSAFQVFSYQL